MRGTIWIVVVFSFAAAGFGARHVEYRSGTEIPEGLGFLSGSDGGIVLYSTRGLDAESGVAPGKSLNEEAGTAAAITRSSMSEGERRRFEDFKRWKEANRDSPEYREFQEWQEWKAFRAWKRNAP